MVHLKEFCQVSLVITILVSILNCRGQVNKDLIIDKVEIIDSNGLMTVFERNELCGFVNDSNSVSISFCKENSIEEKLDKTGNKFLSIIIYSGDKKYEARPMNAIQSQFPKAELVFIVNNAGVISITEGTIVLYKHPSGLPK